ncbi:MAG: DUF4157 domain-containing protein [Kofleriaceae bacterium]
MSTTPTHEVGKSAGGSEEHAVEGASGEHAGANATKFRSGGAIPPVQMAAGGGAAGVAQVSASDRAFEDEDRAQAMAGQATAGSGAKLPFADKIQAAFGRHDISGIRAHTDQNAQKGASAMGAQAFASGNDVVLNGNQDLHTVAHEAAHVVQQRGGVQLKGGVGEKGDPYEQNADAVADRVVAGKSAEDLLDGHAGKGGAGDKAVQSKAIQFLGYELGKPLPAGAEKPLMEQDDQRRYSVDQYEHMWEAEQGKQLTDGDKKTIDRGCIGITANNIAGGGNPLQYAEATFGDFDHAHKFMEGKNKELHQMRADPKQAAMAPQGEYILFAKQFWSNQQDGDNSKPDDKAFRPDPKTGRVDMSGYKYKAQPGMVNFDYGFWDEASQSFWHANHSQPDMVVYQSTKEHFIRGYTDFDRCIFGVALATHYDPGKAAMDANRSHPAVANNNNGAAPAAPDHH